MNALSSFFSCDSIKRMFLGIEVFSVFFFWIIKVYIISYINKVNTESRERTNIFSNCIISLSRQLMRFSWIMSKRKRSTNRVCAFRHMGKCFWIILKKFSKSSQSANCLILISKSKVLVSVKVRKIIWFLSLNSIKDDATENKYWKIL